MTQAPLRGVIAATITPLREDHTPDLDRLLAYVGDLLENGCDAINLLGTTGEATSFGVEQRIAVMRAVGGSGLPLSRFLVGTGTAAIADTLALTRLAGELGFAGALVLPPYYYKPLTDEGLIAYFGELIEGADIPLYLYNFPALSGIAYSRELVEKLVDAHGGRIAGLKDSSGDLAYASDIAAISQSLSVFPSNEAVLTRARDGDFAGCISATANLNSRHCAAAFHDGNEEAQARANAIRGVFDGMALVPAIKTLLAETLGEPGLRRVVSPLVETSDSHRRMLVERYSAAAWAESKLSVLGHTVGVAS